MVMLNWKESEKKKKPPVAG